MAVKIKHGQLVKAVLEAIEMTNSAYCWKMQAGMFKTMQGAIAGRLGRPGVPDICGITRKGKFLGIEIKVGADRQRPSQIEFQNTCESLGAHYIIVKQDANLDHIMQLLRRI